MCETDDAGAARRFAVDAFDAAPGYKGTAFWQLQFRHAARTAESQYHRRAICLIITAMAPKCALGRRVTSNALLGLHERVTDLKVANLACVGKTADANAKWRMLVQASWVRFPTWECISSFCMHNVPVIATFVFSTVWTENPQKIWIILTNIRIFYSKKCYLVPFTPLWPNNVKVSNCKKNKFGASQNGRYKGDLTQMPVV